MTPTILGAAEAEERQRRVAGWLSEQRLRPGDRLAMVAPSSLDYLVTGLAALRLGIVPVLVNVGLTDAERRLILADCDPALVLDADGVRTAGSSGAASVELHPVPRSRPMLYTSGTSGRPKGVWTGLLDDEEALALVEDEAGLWGFDTGDRHLVVAPLHHSAPFRFAAGTLLAGGSVAVASDPHPAALAAAVAAVRPTTTFLAPVVLRRLLDGLEASGGDASSFRLVAHAGAPCPAPLKARALEALPTGSVWEFYGSTEGQFTVCSPEEWADHPGTVGRVRPGRTLSVDGDGAIWCRPPSFARFTYWRDPDKTARAWRDDGSFTVGDLGHLDDGGYLYLSGRRDDLIISGGVNVYPLEVEHVVSAHPAVAEVAVFPVDDESWGSAVSAAVVLAPGASVAEADLRAWVDDRLAPYKRPKRWLLVEAIPHTSTGKVRRSTLAAELGL